MSGSDSTLLPASVTGLTKEAAETTDEDQQAPNTEATDSTMPVVTATTDPTSKATDGTMPVVTAATEPTSEATDGTMPVATATTEPTSEATDVTRPVATAAMTIEETGIFDISKIISINIKELRTNLFN